MFQAVDLKLDSPPLQPQVLREAVRRNGSRFSFSVRGLQSLWLNKILEIPLLLSLKSSLLYSMLVIKSMYIDDIPRNLAFKASNCPIKIEI